MTINTQEQFAIKSPTHVHVFPPNQRRSGDHQVIVDRQPNDQFEFTYGIYLQRHEATVVWTHAESKKYITESTSPKAGAITGSDQFGRCVTLSLSDNEAIGLAAVMCAWMQA